MKRWDSFLVEERRISIHRTSSSSSNVSGPWEQQHLYPASAAASSQEILPVGVESREAIQSIFQCVPKLNLSPENLREVREYVKELGDQVPDQPFYWSSKKDGVSTPFIRYVSGGYDSTYVLGTQLDKTNSSRVVLGARLDGKVVVLKLIPTKLFSPAEEEVYEKLQKIENAHEYFVYGPWFEYLKHGKNEEMVSKIAMVLPYKSGGDLFTLAGKFYDDGISPSKSLIVQVIRTVAYLHQHGIVHRDLKLQNFLYENGPEPRVFLADFGHASVIGSNEQGIGSGTPGYIDPSLFKKAGGLAFPFTPAQDVWSLGMTLALLNGKRAFFQWAGQSTGAQNMNRDEFLKLTNIEPECFEAYKDIYFPKRSTPYTTDELIGFCLMLDPARRVSSSDILAIAEELVISEIPVAPEIPVVSEIPVVPANERMSRKRPVTAIENVGSPFGDHQRISSEEKDPVSAQAFDENVNPQLPPVRRALFRG